MPRSRTPERQPRRKTVGGERLAAYRGKRDFAATPEPTGDEPAPSAKHRPFCVQKHLASHLHYDLRLGHNGVLLSWAVPKGPSLDPADKRLAMRTEDHPPKYVDFEGVIPRGYGAGIMLLWDRGTWAPEPGFEDVDRALEKGELKFRLAGTKLKGSWVLVRTRGGKYARPESPDNGSAGGGTWLLIKHHDGWSGPVAVTELAPLSVKTFGDFADVLATRPEVALAWATNPPARGGEAGRLFREALSKAAGLPDGVDAAPSRVSTDGRKRRGGP